MYHISNTYLYFVVRLPRALFIAILLVLCGSKGIAQPSFEEVFEGGSTQRIIKAFDWTDFHSRSDSANVLFHLNTLLDKAKDRNDKYVELVARHSIAYYHVANLHNEKPWLDELNAITEQAGHTDPMLWANMLKSNGMMYYLIKKEYAKGLGLLLHAHELFTELGYKHNPRAGLFLSQLSWVYYQLGNYQKCIELLTPAQHYSDTSVAYVHLQVLNTLGLAYRNLDKTDRALLYFNKTLQVARQHHDSTWIGVASINISKCYISKGEYKKAWPYAESRYTNSKVNDVRISGLDSCEALMVMGTIDAHLGNTDRAIEYLTRAEKGLISIGLPPMWNLVYYDFFSQMYSAQGDVYKQKGAHDRSSYYYQKAFQYRDSIELVRKETQSQKVQTEIAAQQYLSKMKLLRDEELISVQVRNFSLVVLLLAGAWLFILYNRQRLASRKDQQLFENRKQLLHTEKRHAEEQLDGYIHLLQEKNKKLGEIRSEIERLKGLPKTDSNEHAIESIRKLKHTVIITNEDWFRFKDLFENVHVGFFTRLKKQFPDITQAEMRLMALLKLNVSPNDMADMLGVSPRTIHTTAYRLRKKIPSDMNKDLGEIAGSI